MQSRPTSPPVQELEPTTRSSAAASSSSTSASSSNKKILLKLILLGQAGTGKTSLLNRFVDNTYQSGYKATLGSDMRDVEVKIDDEPVVLQIWDTAGQERFNSLTQSFTKGANCCLLVYDCTRSDSFESLTMWRDQFLSSTRNESSFPMTCVANKCDKGEQKAVSQRRANTWCNQNGDMPFIEVSAKNGENVHQCFMDIARRTIQQIKQEREAEQAVFAAPPSVVLTSVNRGQTSGLQSKQQQKQHKKQANDGGCCK